MTQATKAAKESLNDAIHAYAQAPPGTKQEIDALRSVAWRAATLVQEMDKEAKEGTGKQ